MQQAKKMGGKRAQQEDWETEWNSFAKKYACPLKNSKSFPSWSDESEVVNEFKCEEPDELLPLGGDSPKDDEDEDKSSQEEKSCPSFCPTPPWYSPCSLHYSPSSPNQDQKEEAENMSPLSLPPPLLP